MQNIESKIKEIKNFTGKIIKNDDDQIIIIKPVKAFSKSEIQYITKNVRSGKYTDYMIFFK
jgi:hypothetical protein